MNISGDSHARKAQYYRLVQHVPLAIMGAMQSGEMSAAIGVGYCVHASSCISLWGNMIFTASIPSLWRLHGYPLMHDGPVQHLLCLVGSRQDVTLNRGGYSSICCLFHLHLCFDQ